jgi:CDGSH-type Zn-finger protein
MPEPPPPSSPQPAGLTVRVRPNGPLVIDGPVRVVDQHGNEFPNPSTKPNVALCRCGHSANKPFCDGSHNACGFAAAEPAPLPG